MSTSGGSDQPNTRVPPYRQPGDDHDALLEWRNAIQEAGRADDLDAKAADLEIQAARLRAQAVAVRRAANKRELAAVGKLVGVA